MSKPRIRPLSLALCPLALAAALATQPAQAATRYWTFIGGCSNADWFGMLAGTNSQGQLTCWAGTPAGTSGLLQPLSGDDAFILAPTATAHLLVNFADASRPAFTGAARDLTMYGNTSFAAGLAMDRSSLAVRGLTLGAASSAFLGRMDQSGGAVTVGTDLSVFGGAYNLSGGSLNAGALNLRGQFTDAAFTQTGGILIAPSVALSGENGRNASFSQLAGSVSSINLNIGNVFGSTGTAAVAISGDSTRWDNNGSTLVGNLGSGRLDITAGARASTGTVVIGNAAGGLGQVTVSGAGSTWTVGGLLTIGNGGHGTLLALNGGTVIAASVVLNGLAPPPGQPALAASTLQGAGTVFEATNALVVGRSRDALLEVSDGATLRNDFGVLGEAASISGGVRLSGSGGASWTNNTSLVVGKAGRGNVEVGAANTLRSVATTLGQDAGSYGLVKLSGAQAAWINTGELIVGDSGEGGLQLLSGSNAQLQSASAVLGKAASGVGDAVVFGGTGWQNSGNLVVGDAGTGAIRVSQASLMRSADVVVGRAVGGWGSLTTLVQGSRLDIAGSLVVGSQGEGNLFIGEGATGASGSAILGEQLNSVGVATIDAAGTQWQNAGALVVGRAGAGTLTVDHGGSVLTGSTVLGAFPVGNGTVNVQGAGQLNVNGTLDVGLNGRGRLNIASAGAVTVSGATNVAVGSQIVLDGGSLHSGVVGLGDPARLDWRSGVLHVTGAGGAALDGVALPATLNLLPGRSLQVDQTLWLNADSNLLLSGGSLQVKNLSLQNGVLASTGGGVHALDMDQIFLLTGQGQVAAAVRGGSAASGTITADGGPLTMGLLSRSDGFEFGGVLASYGQQVLLLDRDQAGLGSITALFNGAQLATVNGAVLAAGGLLESQGGSSVQGLFVNNGRVFVPDGTLSFVNDVRGRGSFAGSVRFLAGYSPGDSTAQVTFGHGSVSFGTGARLTLEIDDSTPGTGFDQLLDIASLSFDGTLALDFGGVFSIGGGGTLTLLDFDAFQGRLDASHVQISGIDAGRVDISRLGIDGSISITAVPEPASWALWLAGLGLSSAQLTRRRRTHPSR